MTDKGKILKSASIIALLTILSRICGYLRDQRIALLLGTSPVADSFILAFRIPNMVRRFTGEGALGASFIPVFTGYLRKESPQTTWKFAQRAFWDLAVVLAVVAFLGVVFSKQVVSAFTVFGSSQIHWDLAVHLNRIIFPCILFLGLAGIAAAILNSFHEFALPASTAVAFNVIVIAASFGIFYRPILRMVSPNLPDARHRAGGRHPIRFGVCNWRCRSRRCAAAEWTSAPKSTFRTPASAKPESFSRLCWSQPAFFR